MSAQHKTPKHQNTKDEIASEDADVEWKAWLLVKGGDAGSCIRTIDGSRCFLYQGGEWTRQGRYQERRWPNSCGTLRTRFSYTRGTLGHFDKMEQTHKKP